jgi:hypothetical protein
MRVISAILWLALAGLAADKAVQERPKVQCAGITKAGLRCKRIVKPPAIYCWQHKAQASKKAECHTDAECERMYGKLFHN